MCIFCPSKLLIVCLQKREAEVFLFISTKVIKIFPFSRTACYFFVTIFSFSAPAMACHIEHLKEKGKELSPYFVQISSLFPKQFKIFIKHLKLKLLANYFFTLFLSISTVKLAAAYSFPVDCLAKIHFRRLNSNWRLFATVSSVKCGAVELTPIQ